MFLDGSGRSFDLGLAFKCVDLSSCLVDQLFLNGVLCSSLDVMLYALLRVCVLLLCVAS